MVLIVKERNREKIEVGDIVIMTIPYDDRTIGAREIKEGEKLRVDKLRHNNSSVQGVNLDTGIYINYLCVDRIRKINSCKLNRKE